MAEKLADLKLKVPVAVELKVPVESDEDEENAAKNDVDLGISLDKLSLGPKKKLLVLCLGGLLVHRVHLRDKRTVLGIKPDVVYGKFLVFKRPFCTDFLRFCFERFDVALWSSAREHNIDGVLSIITGGSKNKLVFVWSQEDCIDSGFGCLHKTEKPIFLKRMDDLWGNPKYKGQYSSSNTLLIDDEPHTALLNPANTGIFPQPYKGHDVKDTYLGPNGELRKYLDGLVEAKDVASYVKDRHIGKPAITPSHPNWKYYEKIVARFGKKGEGASSTAKT